MKEAVPCNLPTLHLTTYANLPLASSQRQYKPPLSGQLATTGPGLSHRSGNQTFDDDPKQNLEQGGLGSSRKLIHAQNSVYHVLLEYIQIVSVYICCAIVGIMI